MTFSLRAIITSLQNNQYRNNMLKRKRAYTEGDLDEVAIENDSEEVQVLVRAGAFRVVNLRGAAEESSVVDDGANLFINLMDIVEDVAEPLTDLETTLSTIVVSSQESELLGSTEDLDVSG